MWVKIVAHFIIWLIRLYKLLISPFLPHKCRFLPTCSCYAVEAIKQYGVWRGSWLTLKRLARCHPFEKMCIGKNAGYDPVP